jgi:hypothetical protein
VRAGSYAPHSHQPPRESATTPPLAHIQKNGRCDASICGDTSIFARRGKCSESAKRKCTALKRTPSPKHKRVRLCPELPLVLAVRKWYPILKRSRTRASSTPTRFSSWPGTAQSPQDLDYPTAEAPWVVPPSSQILGSPAGDENVSPNAANPVSPPAGQKGYYVPELDVSSQDSQY